MRRWNVDHQAAIVDNDKPAVKPGESYDFTDEQVEAGLTGLWSEDDPRKGLAEEKAFKARRDKKEPATPAETKPVDTGEKE